MTKINQYDIEMWRKTLHDAIPGAQDIDVIFDTALAYLRLRAQSEPCEAVAWRIDLEDSSYLIDNIDDPQAVDDLTNHGATLTPLYEHIARVESVIARHSGKTKNREWWSGGEWLYPGDEIVSRSLPEEKR